MAVSSLGNQGGRPEFSECIRPASILHTLPSAFTHPCAQLRVAGKCSYRGREAFDVARLSDKAIHSVFHQFLGPAGIRNDYRQTGGLRFDNDVPERVSRAWKYKQIGRRISS